MNSSADSRIVDGRAVAFTHPDKVLYPQTGTTKADVLEYYLRIAPLLLPIVKDRPVTRKRWLHGTGGASFFHRNLGSDTPDWVARRELQHTRRVVTYPLANDIATLAWFAQTASLELHVPQWRFDSRGVPQNPDRLVFDLDPGVGASLADCAGVARLIRQRLTAIGLDPWPVTSGGSGIHVYAHLDGSRTSDDAVLLAKSIADDLESEHPARITSNMRLANRDYRVFIDWSQNYATKTTITPYSLRGKPQPLVAAPRSWTELDDPALAQLSYVELLERIG